MPLPLLALIKVVSIGSTVGSLSRDVVPLVREARRWYRSLHKRSSSNKGSLPESQTFEEMSARVQQLEADVTRQAEIAAEIAAQVEALSDGLQLVAGRTTALLVMTAVAVVAAVAALVLAALN